MLVEKATSDVDAGTLNVELGTSNVDAGTSDVDVGTSDVDSGTFRAARAVRCPLRTDELLGYACCKRVITMRRIGAGLGLAVSTLVLGALARAVARRRTTDADREWVARIGVRERGSERFCRFAAPRAIATEALGLALVPRLRARERAAILLAPLIAGLAGHALKLSLPRDRPSKTRFGPTGDHSFPSTHAAHATSLLLAAATVAHRSPLGPLADAAALTLGALVGIERVRAAAHWPSDAFAGVMLGAASAYATRALFP